MSPLLLKPVLKRARWGGRRLAASLNKPLGHEQDYAESWEVVDRPAEQSVIAAGPFEGRTLRFLMEHHRTELLGERIQAAAGFPLLVKLIDATDRLSVQVHPTCEQAAAMNLAQPGKPEAWVILEAAPGSRLYVGLKRGVTAPDLRAALRAGSIESCLHSFPARSGDCIDVPAGTVHAIGEGVLLAEIQLPSDLTFRLDDWGRLDQQGLPRTLHVEQAFECIDFERGPVNPVEPLAVPDAGHPCEDLLQTPAFVLRRHIAAQPFPIPQDGRFHILLVLEGEADLHAGWERVSMCRGSTVLLPAQREGSRIHPRDCATLLDVFLPDEPAAAAAGDA